MKISAIINIFSINFLSKIIVGLISVYLIRYMAISEYSIYIYCVAIATTVSQCYISAFNVVFINNNNNNNDTKNTGRISILFINCILVILTLFVFNIFLQLEFKLLVLILAAALSTVIFEYSKTIYQSELEFKKYSNIEICKTILYCIGVFTLFAYENITSDAVIIVQTVSIFLTLSIFYNKQKNKINYQEFIKELILYSNKIKNLDNLYLLLYFIIISVISQLDIIYLKKYATSYDLAVYGVATKYWGILMIGIGALHVVLLPTIKNINSYVGWVLIRKKLNKITKLIIPLIFLLIYIIGYIIPILNNNKYQESVLIFRILSIISIVSIIFSPYVNILLTKNNHKFLFINSLINLVISIILINLMYEIFGIYGVALATFINLSILNLTNYLKVKFLINKNKIWLQS